MRRKVAAVVVAYVLSAGERAEAQSASEAPAGFDNQTNGLVDQKIIDRDRAVFEELETIDEGLGPVYNAQGCVECHQSPVTGAASQVNELRAGHLDAFGNFVEAPGGSLINDRATNASIQEQVPAIETIRTFRASLNVLGDGFVEVIDDATLQSLAAASGGQTVSVPVLEAAGVSRLGRFGWKNQHASLLSFAADAYRNEMGITSALFPTENTSLGSSVAAFDPVPDPEDVPKPGLGGLSDVDVFARFMRATRVPPRGPTTAAAQQGEVLFGTLGCASCHVPSITTAPAGTALPGYGFVPAALGGKVIHPFSDFALHDVGTGDGIVQGPAPANKLKTAPLWGLRARSRFMHDGASTTLVDAIRRHGGEASEENAAFGALSADGQAKVLEFLRSL